MLNRAYEGQNCSIASTLEVVGERWTLLIVRDVFLAPAPVCDDQPDEPGTDHQPDDEEPPVELGVHRGDAATMRPRV